MEDEKRSLEQMGTWEIVDRPINKPVIGSRWCYKTKTNEIGEVLRYKARVVAKGYNQQQGIDFFETYAPVLRNESLRLIISYAPLNSSIFINSTSTQPS
jgi:hypothetical protein